MKAVVYEDYAPDDDYKRILEVKDVEDPKPRAGEVVFAVKAAALNYNDIWGMRGTPIPVPLPHISGSDAAGDVVLTVNGVGPDSVDGGEIVFVAGQHRQIGHRGVEVGGAHGVANGVRHLDDRPV